MKYSALLLSLLAVVGLSACEKPTTVNVPPANTTTVVPGPTVVEPVPVPVPGPAGPPGQQGEPGKPGGDVIIVPPAPPAAPSTPPSDR